MEKLLTNPLFLLFTCITVTSVVSSVGHYWAKVRRAEMEAALKQDMIQRGMSAEEIVSVIQASTYGSAKSAPVSACKG